MCGVPAGTRPESQGARVSNMPEEDDQTEAGVASARGTAEEIKGAPTVVLDEAAGAEAPAASPPAAAPAPGVAADPDAAPDPQSQSEAEVVPNAPGSPPTAEQSAESESPPTEPSPENPPASPESPDTTTADTEASLDQIDADLALLESLLAQTSSDGTSIPENIATAPPAPAPVDQLENASAENAADQAEGDAAADDSGDEASQAEIPDDEPTDMQLDGTAASDDLLLDDMAGPAPDVPAAPQPPPPEADAAEAQPAVTTAADIVSEPVDDTVAGMFERLLVAIILTPLMALDMPFAGLSGRVKNVLGLAGIATLLVALVTWMIGNHR